MKVTIKSGESLSGPIDITAFSEFAIAMPDAWDAADLTFQASNDGVSFKNLYDDAGSEVSAKAAAGRVVNIGAAKFAALSYIKIRSGTAAAPVNQTADRDLYIIAKR